MYKQTGNFTTTTGGEWFEYDPATRECDYGPSPAAIDRLIAEAKAHALSANTRKTYRTGCRSWAKWATERALPVLPAAPGDLEGWLATLWLEGKKHTTLSTYLAAVTHEHRDRPGPNPGHDPQVRLLLSGIKSLAAGEGTTTKQAAPLRWEHAMRIADTAHRPRRNQPGGRLETPQQARRRAEIDIALVVAAHDAALRCGELLAITWGDVDLTNDNGCGLVRIRRSKTDQHAKGAVAALSEYTTQALARIKPADAEPGDLVFDLSPSTVARRFKAAAKAAGIDPANITTHSPRVGMAQDLAAAGIDMPGLLLAGRRHTIAIVARYIQDLAAQHTPAAQHLKTQKHPEELKSTLRFPPLSGHLVYAACSSGCRWWSSHSVGVRYSSVEWIRRLL